MGDIHLYDVIVAIDGESTTDMTERDFYDVLSSSNSHQLDLLRRSRSSVKKISGITVQANPEIQQIHGYDVLSLFVDSIKEQRILDVSPSNYCWIYSKRYHEKAEQGLDVLSDKHFDWLYVKSYDIVPHREDPLTDMVLINDFFIANLPLSKRIPGEVLSFSMIRDEDAPDIVFTIAKNASQSISTTYVPPSYAVINNGSRSVPRYSSVRGSFLGYETYNNNTVIKDGDYNVTNVNAALYLEITALDGKKLLLESQKYPPVIWKGTFEEYYQHSINKLEITKQKTADLASRFIVRQPLLKTVISLDYSGIVSKWVQGDTSKTKKAKGKNNSAISSYYLIESIAEDHPLYAKGVRAGDKYVTTNGSYRYYRDDVIIYEAVSDELWYWQDNVTFTNYGLDMVNLNSL